MLATIILLYALNAPKGCFIAAYIILGFEIIYRLIRLIKTVQASIESKEVNKAIIGALRNKRKTSP